MKGEEEIDEPPENIDVVEGTEFHGILILLTLRRR